MFGKKIILMIVLCAMLLTACGTDDYNVDCLDNTADVYCKEHNFTSGKARRMTKFISGEETEVIDTLIREGLPLIQCALVAVDCDLEREFDCEKQSLHTNFRYLPEEINKCSVKR